MVGALQVSERYEEGIRLFERIGEKPGARFFIIKEAVSLAFVGDELNGVAFFLRLYGKQFGGAVGYGGVFRSMENNGGRKVGAEVVIGRELLGRHAHPIFQSRKFFGIAGLVSFDRREHKRGIEECECVGHGADGGVFVGFIEGADGAERAGEMAAGRSASGSNTVGIDAEALGILPYPPDGGLGIAEAGDGLNAVAVFHAVFDGDGDHAAGSEIGALLFKLGGGAAVPAAAEEKDDGRALVAGFQVVGFEDMKGQFDAGDGFVDFSAGTGQGFGRCVDFLLGGNSSGQKNRQTGDQCNRSKLHAKPRWLK